VNQDNKNRLRGAAWLAGLILLVAAFYLILEHFSPYYFLEDDNRDCTLPMFVHYFRGLAAGGPAFFNFHQYLGNPSIAASPVFYPPLYASVWLSRMFSGDVMWSMDIFAFLHAALAACGMYLFARRMGAERAVSFWAGALWAMNGFVMFVAPSWWIALPVFAWAGWLHFLLLRLMDKPSLGNAVMLAGARLILFYSGYPQYVAYEFILESVFALALLYGRSGTALPDAAPGRVWEFARAFAFSAALAAVCALPLALPTLHQMSLSRDRGQPFSYGELAWLKYRADMWLWGLVWPFTDTRAIKTHFIYERFARAGFASWVIPYTAHISYVAQAALILLAARWRQARGNPLVTALAVCAALSLLWGAGALNWLVYFTPLLNRLRWTFKMGIFVNFYLIALAAWGMRGGLGKRSGWIFALAMALTLADMGAMYARNFQHSFITHDVPNPITEPLRDKLSSGRLFSLGYVAGRDSDPGGIVFNYATLWGLYHFAGYDAFVLKANYDAAQKLTYLSSYCGVIHPNTIAYFRRWGVNRYVIKKSSAARYGPVLSGYGLSQEFEDSRRVIYSDPKAMPMLFREESGAPLEFRILPNRLEFDAASPSGGAVIANFLHNGFFRAEIDGRDCGPAGENKHHQLRLVLAPGRHHAAFVYRNEWFYRGIYLALAGAALLFLFAFIAVRRFRNSASGKFV